MVIRSSGGQGFGRPEQQGVAREHPADAPPGASPADTPPGASPAASKTPSLSIMSPSPFEQLKKAIPTDF